MWILLVAVAHARSGLRAFASLPAPAGLRPRGVLKIAEVSSRVEDLPAWLAMLRGLGFDLLAKDTSNTHFLLLDLVKSSRPPQPAEQLDVVPLKPCIYKRR